MIIFSYFLSCNHHIKHQNTDEITNNYCVTYKEVLVFLLRECRVHIRDALLNVLQAVIKRQIVVIVREARLEVMLWNHGGWLSENRRLNLIGILLYSVTVYCANGRLHRIVD